MTEPEGGWRDHMHFDAESRRGKARKIVTLIETQRRLDAATVLEIGTGTGAISAELARAVGPAGRMVSCDVMDTRSDSSGYEFFVTQGVTLPFDDDSFDVVVTNHVIEHVGDRADQQGHLTEIKRVLRPDGVAYLATPTRWALIEPHFKVPLLSWPPRGLRDRYVQLTRKGRVYNVDPFSPRQLEAALDAAGFTWRDVTLQALDVLVQVEKPSRTATLAAGSPAWAKRLARPAMPTMIYLLKG
jgi:SAM-dependent methyltransferase